MRFVFSVCGIGMGHSQRSYRLMQFLRELGHEIYVITSGDGSLFFRDKEFPKFIVEDLDFEWGEAGLSLKRTVAKSVESGYVLFKHYRRERSIIRDISPDIVVADSRGAPLIVCRQYDIPSVLITNQLAVISGRVTADKLIASYMPRFWALSDKIIIPDMPPPYTITYLNNVYPLSLDPSLGDKVYFIGPLLSLKTLNMDLRSFEDKKYDVFIFVSAPSLDRKYYSMTMMRLARELARRYSVLLSIGEPGFRDYEVVFDNLEVRGWVRDPFESLSMSRVVILRGGQTAIMESIIAGTPMLVIPALNQTEQLENARRVKSLGIGEFIYPDDFYRDKKLLFNGISMLMDNYDWYYHNIINVRNKLLSSGGVEKAVEIILSCCQS